MTRSTLTLIVRAVLSLVYVTGNFAIIWLFMSDSKPLDQDRREMLMFLFGSISNGALLVLQFWLGSSQGSADKSAKGGEV
jgi:formate hydrogenlyase subunit 3/multisubunit Na+/H+ antiporter MnhD subunit